MDQVQIFISYAREDSAEVMKLYRWLESEGFKPWMDKVDLLGGMQWRGALEKALRQSDFFLLCLSPQSANKRGFIQREINFALDLWQEKLQDDIYIIPVRIEECEIPDRVADFHWVDWFTNDGSERLLKSFQYGLEKLGKTRPMISQPLPSQKALPPALTTSTVIRSPLPPTERIESVSDAQRVEATAIAQPSATASETSRVQITPTSQPEIKQRSGNRWTYVIAGSVLLLVTGILLTLNHYFAFSQYPMVRVMLAGLAAGAIVKLIEPGKDSDGIIMYVFISTIGALMGVFAGSRFGVSSKYAGPLGLFVLLTGYGVIRGFIQTWRSR